jgi:hypothetical protein
MESPRVTPFEEVLEVVEQLSPIDQAALVEIIRQRLVEQRRGEIAMNAQTVRQAFREGRAQYGNVDDIVRVDIGTPATKFISRATK